MERDRALVAFHAFTALAAAGWAVAVGGLAAMQADCAAHPERVALLISRYNISPTSADATCATFLRKYWFAIAWTALALALPPLTHCGKHFKAVRGAAWALLTSASIFNAIICNATLARALDGEESTTAPAVATAGFALLVASSCGIIGAGSAVEHGQRRAALGGIGAESKLWRAATLVPRTLGRAATGLFEVRQRARAAAAGALALMAAGWAIALGGSAAVQAECSRDPAAMRAFRLAYYPYQDAGDNTVDCARAFAELWWAWALATATLFVAAGVAAARQMARFRAAGFALLISCGTFNFLVITALLHWYHDTTGAFRAASCAALSGFIVFDVGAFALIFAGAAYAHAAQRAGLDSVRAAPHAARRARAARAAFAALQAVAWAALAAALVALALAQSDLTAGEAAPPTVVFYLRFDWFIWAVAVAGLALGGGTVHVAALARFKAAAWLLLVYAANLSMLVCTRTYKVLPRLEGDPRGPVIAKLVAFCVWDAAAYLMLFAGSAAAWEARGAAAEVRGGEGESEDEDEAEEREAAASKA